MTLGVVLGTLFLILLLDALFLNSVIRKWMVGRIWPKKERPEDKGFGW